MGVKRRDPRTKAGLRTALARTTAAALMAVGVLTGCGGQGPDDRAGTADDAGKPTGEGGQGRSPDPGPDRNPTGQPSRPSLPQARKPVLHVKAAYTYTVRILDATLTTTVPGDNPPPAGTRALALLLRVEAQPRDRDIKAPYGNLAISYPSLNADKDARIGGVMDGATPYMTEDQMLFGEGVQGVNPMFGVLEANTVYYHLAWQIVSEKADLTGASLCRAELNGDNCIPIGPIKTSP
ncbi:hypothetical protein [Streptomyces californicus]|uniref:hypothetical protein n=1 Tax=Streptomyces californicus TaxID=67351 RepID=UPI00296E528C|nr:hypothetical protein [Streptomyces californicus]MDW4918757.1 hypothetical protein [Streptomyces californicus]